jgi:hypothetical protein
MYRVALTISCCVLALGLVACDKAGADKSAEAKPEDNEANVKQDAAKQAEAPTPVAEPAKPEATADERGIGGVIHAAVGDEQPAAAPDAAAPDAAATPDGATPEAEAGGAAPPAAPHFDTSKDQGSMLDHLASSLVHDDSLSAAKGAMAALASLAVGDKTPSDATICAHVWAVLAEELGDMGDKTIDAEMMESSKHEIEKERLKLGPQVFAEAAACIMAAKNIAGFQVCDKAEQEAEQALHEKPHGDGLDKATCEKAVDHMFALLRKDMGNDPDLLKILDEDLESYKADAVIMCMDTATKAEVECMMKAKTIAEVEVCD